MKQELVWQIISSSDGKQKNLHMYTKHRPEQYGPRMSYVFHTSFISESISVVDIVCSNKYKQYAVHQWSESNPCAKLTTDWRILQIDALIGYTFFNLHFTRSNFKTVHVHKLACFS